MTFWDFFKVSIYYVMFLWDEGRQLGYVFNLKILILSLLIFASLFTTMGKTGRHLVSTLSQSSQSFHVIDCFLEISLFADFNDLL